MIFMIKAISNPTNQTTMHTTHAQAPTPAHRPTIFSRTRSLLHIALAAMLMLCFTANANAQWTDPSTGVTFTPQSGTGGTGDEGWAKGCDGSITTKHGGTKTNNSTTWELVVQASQAIKLTGYTITTANDNSSETGRSPYTWKVQGSNSNGNWTDIDSRTNVTTIKNVNYIEYEFQCSTDNYYTYFRFYITAINGGTYMQYSEFHPIGETSGAYAPGTSCAGGTYGPNNVGYVITNGSVYLGGTSTTAINSFNPQTCLWSTTGTSNVVWRNTAGYNLYSNNNGGSLSLNASSTRTWDLVGTESGTTGMRIKRYNNNNYVYLNGSAWATANTTAYIAFAATKTTHYATYTVPEIGGTTEITALGVNNINTIATNAAYRQKYYDYIFRNGAHHYVDDDDETYLGTTAPSASTFTYTWSLDGISSDYATINETTGVISYTNSVSSDVVATVKMTASSTEKTFVVTKDVTFKVVPPTSITPSTSNLTVYVGSTGTFTYTLAPVGSYHNVSVSSGSNSVATAVGNNAGTVTITPVAVGNTTITLSAARPGTTALTTTVNVAVKNKVAKPVIQFDQIDEGATATASISCPTNGATIYYTHTRGGQTIASGTYTSSFTVNEYDQVEAYASMVGNDLWDNSETITETYVSCTTLDPVISYTPSGSTATVTITAESGATIYYTTNGDNPKTSSNLTGTTSVTINVNGGITIKAYAKNGNCNASEVISKEIITTGASASVVTLYDYEDHSWSYYSDGTLPEQLRSLNPADVKITYYGNGTNNINVTTDNTTPNSSNWTSSAKSVQVSNSETANTFIYYKTLERTDGSTSNPTGRCAYTPIPNPFTIRPTFSISGTKYYTGFYKWRVVSIKGGSIYAGETGGSALATANTVRTDNVMLDADQTYYFAPDSEYGMEVEFEAMWARAYTTTSTNDLSTKVTGTNAYERNFHIVTSSQSASSYQKSYPLTVSALYPDGTNGGGSVTGGFTAAAITKFENISITGASSSTWSANGKGLIIGRGCSGTIANLYGATSAPTSSFSLRVESGSFTSSYLLYFGNSTQVSSNITINGVYGCDYDRANNETNTNLSFSNVVEVGYRAYGMSASAKINMTVLSGTFGTNAANKEFYLGFENGGTAVSQAVRTLEVYGGNFLGGIAGGFDKTGNTASSVKVNMRMRGGTVHRYLYGAGQYSECSGARRIIITGGTYDGWIAGGAYGTESSGGATDGDISLYFGGNANQTSNAGIFGAGYGTGNTGNGYYTVNKSNVVISDNAQVAGSAYGGGNNGYATDDIKVYVGGGHVAGDVYGGANKAPSSKDVTVTVKGGSVTGGVYGGSNQSGAISGQITVDVYGTDPQPNSGYSIGQVFGGGNVAAYSKTPNVTIYCGDNISIGEVYGGGNNASVSGTNVTVSGGNRIGYVYGGGRQAAVNGNTSVKIYGGTIEHAFAGNNISGNISGTLSIQVDRGNDDCLLRVGELYGGGNQAASKAGSITIGCTGVLTDGHNNLSSTNRIGYELEGIGDVYGGANNANITSGNITLNIVSGMIARVFGGNNVDGSISGNISVSINKNSSTCGWYVGDVFGAGNLATYTGNPTINILNGTVSRNVYGGGKGELLDGNQRGVKGKVTGSPSITIGDNVSGHTVTILGEVYGGGDAADVTGTPVIVVNDHSTAQSGAHVCSTHIGYLYGGGNAADVGGTNITINGGTITHAAFGGGHGDKDASNPSKYADVKGNVVFNINGGNITQVFAGSNSKGNISGSSTLTIEKSGNCPMIIGEVYGGGNQAAGNAGTISINCTGDLVTGNSGHEANPNNIGVTLEGIGTVYGGANAADIGTSQTNSNITLNINSGMVANVFGGNNQTGNIYGTIQVNINKDAGSCGWYVGNVFGGGNLAIYSGTPSVNIKNGTVSGNVYGGGNGDPDDETQEPGQVAGSEVTIGDNTNTSGYAVVVGNVYGGGNAAKVAGNTSVTYNDTNASSNVAKLFGGGQAAGVTGTSTVTLTAGSVSAGVYGGCDSEGTVGGDISVYLNGGTVGATNNRADVFGGGLGSATATGGHIGVTFGAATVYGDIYGGSALGQVNGSTSHTTNVTINGTALNGTVYGGGKGQVQGDSIKAISNGNIIVNYNGVNTGLIRGIYGGANVNGNVKGNIQVNILANVGATGNNSRNIFGGGYGDATTTEGNIEVNIGTLDGNKTPIIYGDIYGGSALGDVNKDANNTTKVNFRNGTLHGNLYGGGLGQKTPTQIAAKVYGKVQVNVGASNQSNCAINLTGVSIFGCNNTNGSPQDDVEVNIYNTAHNTTNAASYTQDDGTNGAPTYAIYQVFGGGNEADYSPAAGKKATVNILGCLNTIQRVFGGGNAAAALGVVTVIDGGRFDYVFGGGNGEVTAANIGAGGTNLTVHGGKINYLFGGSNAQGNISGAMGVSVDATGSCASDMYISEFFCGNNLANMGTAQNPVTINATIGCNTKFGDVYGGCNLADIVGNVTLTVVGGEMNRVFGGSKGRSATSDPSNSTPKAANIDGDVTLNITGGKIGSAFGGSNINGNITGSIEVNVEKAADPCIWQIGDVFGASNDAEYNPTKQGNTLTVNIKNGNIGGSVFGGGKGQTATAHTNPQVTIGDATEGYTVVISGDVYGGGDAAAVIGTPVVHVINKSSTSIGNVYGGGNAANVSATSVTIDGGTITGDVYGGGHGDKAILNVGNETGHSDKVANVNGNVSVTVTGGTINRVFGGSNTNGNISGTVTVNVNKGANSGDLHITELYGGGNLAAGNAGTISIGCTGGANEGIGDVYGGANQADIGSSSQASNIALSITGGKIGRVFGGNNTSGTIYGTIQVNIDWATGNDACGVNSLGSVFGGGNQASYSAPSGSTNYPVVNIKNGTITNNVFGGGLGSTAVVTGNPQVTIGDATRLNNDAVAAVVQGDVYGGGDAASVSGTPVVRVINKCNTSIGYVYGGGNAANVSATSVTIDGGTITGDVYGGGHGDKASLGQGHSDKVANVNGNVSVTVTGGTINRVFGGSNANGNISGTVAVNVNKGANSCDLHITELYGGGNMANGNAGNITIGCTGGANEGIGDVYGGANQADIGSSSQASNIALSITGGKIGRVFGGNNTSGTIYGTIQVNVEWATGNDACGVNSLGSVFGGGNQAAYSAPTGSTNYPVVNIKNGTITNNVFGGGLGSTAVVTGNPQVTIGDATAAYAAVIQGDVYGGGDAASVTGTPMVRVINKSNTSIANVYGGGNAADVSATSVTIDGGTITGDVFGGGHGDKASLGQGHSDKTANVGGSVSVSITGGTIHRVFGGSNTNGNINGTVAVNVNKGDTSGEMHIDELYGGGNVAAGNAGNITIGCTGGATEGIGDVYGGANAADVNNGIALTISGGHINRVFGGNNTSGSISGSIQVNVNWNANSTCGDNYIGYVYGGGNQAAYTNRGNNYPEVNIINGTIAHNVYGGGLGASARVTANPHVVLTGGTITGKVFGGGEAAPVTGNPTVTASGANVTATRLYGGGLGSSAVVTGNTTVTVSGGTYGYVFGGGEEASQTGDVVVNIQGGTITNDVYGGGALAHTNTAGSKTTTVNLTGGTMKNAYGGGLGDATTEALVYGNVAVNLNYGVAADSKGAVVTDYLFGCNNINGSPKGSVTVHVYSTQNSATGSVLVKNQDSYDMKGVYGGGNMAAYKPTTSATATNVIIEGCGLSSIEYVYGGGNAAPVPATDVKIYGSYKIGSVFGGGNGKDQITVNGVLTDNPGADVGIYKVDQDTYDNAGDLKYTDNSPNHDKGNDRYILYGSTTGESIIGTTKVTFYGGNVGHLFGGSNTKGDIVKESKVILGDEDLKTCEFNVDDVYGGSNEAYMSGTSNIDMNCTDGMGQIYGGSRMADVHNDIVLTITGGHYQKVFGGNNLSGRIYGSITVNIEQTGCLPIEIDELYGGGNEAAYSVYGYNGNTPIEGNENDRLWADPQINIKSFKSIGTVFGGGYGESAVVIGNPTININTVEGWTNGDYQGKNTDPEHPDPHAEFVRVMKNLGGIGEIGTVFGGGNEAVVKGDTYINIGTQDQVTIHNVSKEVYNAIKDSRNAITTTGQTDITNPGFTDQDDDDATKNLTITVNGVNITGNVYGGGNNADVTGGTHVTVGKEQQGGGGVSPAPQRSAEPAQANQPEQSQQPEQPQQPQSNAATESQQTRTINATRL